MTVPRAGVTLPTLAIHPSTATRLGLVDADAAVVSNARGELKGIVRLTDTVAPGTIACVAHPWMTGANLRTYP